MQTVFHVSSDDPADQRHALRNVVNLLADESVSGPDDDVVLVANGGAVRLFLSPTTPATATVADLRDAGVALYACGNSLRRLDASDADLLPGVERVPSGVGRLASLQQDGFGYLKVP
ncbi:DsrE family protein [Salinirubrum litoreum]|uniref:DsrE family protein n=1 Tax=Salinirubrum litoreum TaxID=1126234 RepID=A0ABD5RG58_9EURY|nr:DsrE family protein [Salinirubrum litoreum]